ncbi:MAG: nucleotide exchange factor GrpE [Holosporales bacterium]|jgi:molecular chaperone GrpE|nr:nucleotide exchange factor GrpE [Holosporales bacterium]
MHKKHHSEEEENKVNPSAEDHISEYNCSAETVVNPIAEKDAEISKLKDSLLRAMAENENFQKRAQREKDDLIKYSLSKFARDLLPVLDNFSRALTTTGDGSSGLFDGIKMTEKELVAVLERYGVKPVKAASGDVFDPAHHQAMVEVERVDIAPGHIAEILQPGYVIHDRLLRPALVSVVKDSGAEIK